MTSIIPERVYNFVQGPAKAHLRVREFLAALKTYCWPSAALWSGCLFDTFLISILNSVYSKQLTSLLKDDCNFIVAPHTSCN